MAQSPAPSDPSSQAEDLYAQYLSQRESPGGVDIEAWCARHGGQAEALRRLHAQYAQWKSIFDRLAGSAPQGEGGKRLADELKERYGDVDPGVSLDGGRPRDDSGPSSDLLRRLRTHAPSNSRYRLLGEVGRGGMGAVIRVWDEDLRRTLAMKVVLGKEDALGRGPTPPVDSKTLGRFLEEAQITGQLDHPGIVPVHELGLGSDGQVYFTMRLVRGVDLRTIFQHVEQGLDGWSTTRALGVMLKVCEAMAYAHSKGVIHRDLKPANIMVGRYGEVYVMDWGLARVAGGKELHDLRLKDQPPPSSQSVRTERREERTESPDSPLVTMDGDVMGTPAYMPPEQARGELANLGAHSDVYAVGAMLYHLLLVKHIEMPYVPKGARMSQHRVLMSVIEESPKGLAGYDKTVPAPLVAIVEKAMERDIARRYRDMDELAADLRAYIEGRVVKAYETGTWAETKQWVRRNKPLTAAVAAAFLALVGGIGLTLREQARTEKANQALGEKNSVLLAQAREQQLRGMIQELARFRAQCRTLEGLERLGKPAYRWWLDEASNLLDGQAEDLASGVEWRPGWKDVQAKLAELRGAALDYTEADRARDEATHPVQERLRRLESQMAEELAPIEERLAKAQEAGAGVDAGLIAEQAAVRARFDRQSAPLRAESKERRTWRFRDSQQEWWHAQLTALDGELRWLATMREVAVASTESELAKARWYEAIEGIARSPKYAGQRWPSGDRLTPQAGLLPLGANPVTGLWEFVHLQTGVEPTLGADGRVLRDAEGRLTLTPETGMVLMLLPGGRVPVADSEDQRQANWIPQVALSPFFLSKYELTAEQWDRVSIRRGRHYTDGKALTPANNISWDDISAMWLRELGWCGFPSETQWEYGCRGGTTTTWWTGNEVESLEGAGNVRYDDMLMFITPVGKLRANAFGLHDVHGNVIEWCGDPFGATADPRAGDGLRDDGVANPDIRVLRGGFLRFYPVVAGSAEGFGATSGLRDEDYGLRPSRGITP